MIFLDAQHRVLQHSRLFSGTLNHVEVHPREIVREAIKLNASAVILAHNHPSGCAGPSKADKLITEARDKSVADFARYPGARHLIIGRGEYVSLRTRLDLRLLRDHGIFVCSGRAYRRVSVYYATFENLGFWHLGTAIEFNRTARRAVKPDEDADTPYEARNGDFLENRHVPSLPSYWQASGDR